MYGLIKVTKGFKKEFIKDFTTKEELREYANKNGINNFMIKDYKLLSEVLKTQRQRKSDPMISKMIEVKKYIN